MSKKNNKIVAKKKVKKVVKNSMALTTISYNDIVKADMFDNKKDGRSLHLLKSHFPKTVIDFINMPTPRKYVLRRAGTGGKSFDYIPGWYARKCANYAFGFNHSFEIKSKEIVGLSAIVEGRFIIHDLKTGREVLHKDDIGGHEIRFKKNLAQTPINAVNLANDYKAAATDCMKRCMAQIGFWKDVYGMNEAKDDGVQVQDPTPTIVVDSKDAVSGPDNEPVFLCTECDAPLTEPAADYSKRIYGKILCKEHQPKKK